MNTNIDLNTMVEMFPDIDAGPSQCQKYAEFIQEQMELRQAELTALRWLGHKITKRIKDEE
jgi:hypothetical protein